MLHIWLIAGTTSCAGYLYFSSTVDGLFGLGHHVLVMNRKCILYPISISQMADDYIPNVKEMKSMEPKYW